MEKYLFPVKETLNTDRLNHLLKQVQERPVVADLSDMELASLARIYIAVHNMVVVGDLEKEFGSREFYFQRIEELHALCNERLNLPQLPLERRIPLIYTLYQLLLNPTLCTVDGEKQRQCDTLAYGAVMDYLQKVSAGRWDERPKMEFEVCRLITELCCNLSEEEREEEEMVLYFRRKLIKWTESLVNGNHWTGISDLAALQRLSLFCRNSEMFLDTTYDCEIRLSWEYYSKRVLFIDKRSIVGYQVLALFYEITSNNDLISFVVPFIQQIIELMRQGCEIFLGNSEEQLFCLAWAVEGTCKQRLRETDA